MNANISTETTPLTTFVQTWTATSLEHQEKWFATMRQQVVNLTGQPGFVSMSMHRGDDGKHIVVYAQWRSVADLHTAVGSGAARAGHDELVKWAAPDGGATYAVENVFGPSSKDHVEGHAPPPSEALLAETKQRWAERGFQTRVVSVNGIALHVAEAGQGDPVLLLHGYPQSGECWRLVAPALARSHRVIIPDLRGSGLSEAAKDGYDLETLAEDLHQLTSSMGIKTLKIVGHDWGASVGAVYSMRHRGEVSQLALLEGALPGAGFETLWNFSERNDAFTFVPFLLMGQSDISGDTTIALMKDRESGYMHHLWDSFTGDKIAAPFATWAPYIAAMTRPGVAAAGAALYRSTYQSAEQVRRLVVQKLGIPVLAIAGEKSVGNKHEALVRAFASNVRENVVLTGAGHFLAEERPTEVTAALQAFLAGPAR